MHTQPLMFNGTIQTSTSSNRHIRVLKCKTIVSLLKKVPNTYIGLLTSPTLYFDIKLHVLCALKGVAKTVIAGYQPC